MYTLQYPLYNRRVAPFLLIVLLNFSPPPPSPLPIVPIEDFLVLVFMNFEEDEVRVTFEDDSARTLELDSILPLGLVLGGFISPTVPPPPRRL